MIFNPRYVRKLRIEFLKLKSEYNYKKSKEFNRMFSYRKNLKWYDLDFEAPLLVDSD